MSERLPDEEDANDQAAAAAQMEERYTRLNIEAGHMGEALYYGVPAFTVLVKTQEEFDTLQSEFSEILSKYIDQILVGPPHEASLILSLNKAAADAAVREEVIAFLREKVKELTGSYEAAGDWAAPS